MRYLTILLNDDNLEIQRLNSACPGLHKNGHTIKKLEKTFSSSLTEYLKALELTKVKTPLLAGNTDAPRSVHGGEKRGRRALTLERHTVLVGPRTAAVLLKESYLNDLTFKLQRLEEKPTVSSEFTQQFPPISCRCPFKIPPPKTFPMLFLGKACHSCTVSEDNC